MSHNAPTSQPDNGPNRETPAHDIEAIPNSGGGFTHYCRICGQMSVTLAPELPCPGPPLKCPLHGQTGCSPLLNGCQIVNALTNYYPRDLVDAAIAGVAETYTPEGVRIWWTHWAKPSTNHQHMLELAQGYGGMVAT